MSRQHHYYEGKHLHFLTASTYRRAPLFDSELFRQMFIRSLEQLQTELEFRLQGGAAESYFKG